MVGRVVTSQPHGLRTVSHCGRLTEIRAGDIYMNAGEEADLERSVEILHGDGSVGEWVRRLNFLEQELLRSFHLHLCR